MASHVTLPVLAALAFVVTGCHSDEISTRAYKLDRPQTDAALVNSVLDEEWNRHSVMSDSRVTDEGYAVVKTTPRGHSAIQAKLREERQ
jgi:hypothetical protein